MYTFRYTGRVLQADRLCRLKICALKRDGVWRWDCGRPLGHKDGTLMNGISALIKETPREFFHPAAM